MVVLTPLLSPETAARASFSFNRRAFLAENAILQVALFVLSGAGRSTVKIVTEPGDAQIFVNGERKGNSPADVGQTFAIKLEQGDYTIEASKDGASAKKQVYVASDTLQTISLKLSSLKDNGDGTVTDSKTGLMWMQCSVGQTGKNCTGEAAKYKWGDAMSRFGKGVSFAGHGDWRMPSKDELNTLVYCSNGTPKETAWKDGCGYGSQKPTIEQQMFPNTAADWYRTSTTREKDASGVWFVYFGDGVDAIWGDSDVDPPVRLVRSGQ